MSLQKLNLKGLVECYSYGMIDGQFYVESVPLVRSLKGYMSKEKITRIAAYNLSLDITECLKEAFDAGFVHGNLKPSNINLDKHYNICLYDLSVGWMAARGVAATKEGFNPINNVKYAAPEFIAELLDSSPLTPVVLFVAPVGA